MKVSISLLAILLVGCVAMPYGPVNDAANNNRLRTQVLASDEPIDTTMPATWLKDSVGFQQVGNSPAFSGALVLTDRRLAFATWDAESSRYRRLVNIRYKEVSDVRLAKLGYGRSVIVYCGDRFYTFIVGRPGSAFSGAEETEKLYATLFEKIKR